MQGRRTVSYTHLDVYKRQGVECGLFSEKIPGLDCISFGPNILNIHTTNEHLDIASVERTWKLILEVLEKLK